MRVAELADFLLHIAPVLEQRLAESAIAGHTGELEISFYRDGLRLGFEQRRLAKREQWRPEHPNFGDAHFPDLTFLQLLFGYRSLEDLEYAFADCGTRNDEVWALLDVLFPKQASHVYTIE